MLPPPSLGIFYMGLWINYFHGEVSLFLFEERWVQLTNNSIASSFASPSLVKE